MTPHHRELADWLRHTYAVKSISLIPGGKHPRLEFYYNDQRREYVVPSSTSDTMRAGHNARADLRRMLGPVPAPTIKPRTTLEEMTSVLNARTLPNLATMNRTNHRPATVGFYGSGMCSIRIPNTIYDNLVVAKAGEPLDNRFTLKFTAPDMFQVSSSIGKGGKFRRFGDTYSYAHYIPQAERQSRPFHATEAEVIVEDGTLLLRVLKAPPALIESPAISKPVPTISSNTTHKVRVAIRKSSSYGNRPVVSLSVSKKLHDQLNWLRVKAYRIGPDHYEFFEHIHGIHWDKSTNLMARVGIPRIEPNNTKPYGFTEAQATYDQNTLILTVKVNSEKAPFQPKPRHNKPPAKAADATKAEVSKPKPDYAAAMRNILEEVRKIEAQTPYKLTRLRHANGTEELSWRAPSIT